MGGLGSGVWEREGRKQVVENCAVIGVPEIIAAALRRVKPYSVKFCHEWLALNCELGQRTDGDLILSLVYRLPNIGELGHSIPLLASKSTFGVRRWFSCPLIHDGIPCRRKCSKLYLPRGGKFFGCRKCYGLTYRSAQQAHVEERLTEWLAGI